jgi:valyl-tRNA synthetase
MPQSFIIGPAIRSDKDGEWFNLLTKADIIHRRKRMQGTHIQWHSPTSPSILFGRGSSAEPATPGTSFSLNTEVKNNSATAGPPAARILTHMFQRDLIYFKPDRSASHSKNHPDAQSRNWWLKAGELGRLLKSALRRQLPMVFPESWNHAVVSWFEKLTDTPITDSRVQTIHLNFCQPCGRFFTGSSCCECSESPGPNHSAHLPGWFATAAAILTVLGWESENGEPRLHNPAYLLMTTPGDLFPLVPMLLLLGYTLTGAIPVQEILVETTCKVQRPSLDAPPPDRPRPEARAVSRDKLRFAYSTSTACHRTHPISPDRLKVANTHLNKIWNASRFVWLNTGSNAVIGSEHTPNPRPNAAALSMADRWFLHAVNILVERVNQKMELLQLAEAADSLYHFFRHEFCGWYLEFSKVTIHKPGTRWALRHSLISLLKLLHPFLPFLTEEIFQQMGQRPDQLVDSEYPTFAGNLVFPEAHESVQELKRLIVDTRRLRASHGIHPRLERPVHLRTSDTRAVRRMNGLLKYYNAMARSSHTLIEDIKAEAPKGYQGESSPWIILMPLKSEEEMGCELRRLEKESKKVAEQIRRMESKLLDEQFVQKHSASSLARLKRRLQEAINRHRRYQKTIRDLT